MNESTSTAVSPCTVTIFSLLTVLTVLAMDSIRPAQAQIFGGALKGAIIGGIIGGDDGAEAGAILGGIGGAMQAGARRHDERRRRDYFERQEMERRKRMEDERLRLERERNEMLRQQQAAPQVQSADAKLVQQVQSALTLMGFDIGPADGQLNEATATAIRSYQQSSGLLATGSPSAELLEHMKQNL